MEEGGRSTVRDHAPWDHPPAHSASSSSSDGPVVCSIAVPVERGARFIYSLILSNFY